MALLTVRSINVSGAAINRSAVTASDTISGDQLGNDGVVLDVNNANAGTCTVTVVDPGATPSGNPAASTGRVISIPTGGQRQILVPAASVNPSTGVATITYSPTSSVTAEAYRY